MKKGLVLLAMSLLMACSNGDEQESLVTKPEDPQIENPSNAPTIVVMKEREDISLTAEGSKINNAVKCGNPIIYS